MNFLTHFIKRRSNFVRSICSKTSNSFIVTTSDGQLRGKIDKDHYEGKYYSFQGIPYAKPPVGKLRFKAPQPQDPWTGVRDATVEGNPCYAFDSISHQVIGSEDCLYLNVYTPQLPKQETNLKPVMVFFHGGGFINGSATKLLYNPDFLIPHDVILVTINYRYGLLGFLNFEDPTLEIPGNSGLKDQVMALKWIQKNIEHFNGDPNNITIFGESSGAASVQYLMLSPMAEGLFHKAIMSSGCVLSPWAQGMRSAPLISQELNLSKTTTDRQIFQILEKMLVKEIYKLENKLPMPYDAGHLRAIAPIIETSTSEPAFISKKPIDLLKSGRFAQVPLIIGYCSREGILHALYSNKKHGAIQSMQDFEDSIPYCYGIKKGEKSSKEIAQKMKQFYYGDETPSLKNVNNTHLAFTDTQFLNFIYTSVKYHTKYSLNPVYYYRMSVESKLNLFKKISQITDPGVCHSDILWYLFKNPRISKIQPNSIEDIAINRFTRLWTNFARTGNPNPVEDDHYINVKWQPTENNRYHFLDIGENLTVGTNPDYTRMSFWDGIFKSCPHLDPYRIF